MSELLAEETRMSDVCTTPPAGWICTRVAGHEGPCAAEPACDLDQRERLMIELAYCRHMELSVSDTAARVMRFFEGGVS